MNEKLAALGEGIAAAQPCAASIAYGELMLEAPANTIVALLTYLRDDSSCLFTQLLDVCGVDYPQRPKRFDVVYNLLSMKHNTRIRVKIQADEMTPVPSVEAVFPTAGWFEREAFDMYGILFSGNKDLRRILTDYGFDGHPLRKDFPLTGYVEMRYDNERKEVIYEPVKLTQEFRSFDFESPWEGVVYTQPLPPEEKKAS